MENLVQKQTSASNERKIRSFETLCQAVAIDGSEALAGIQQGEFSEGAMALKLLAGILHDQKDLNRSREQGTFALRPKNERKQLFREFTQFSFLFTHFLIENGEAKGLLAQFWKACEKIALETGVRTELQSIRKGMLTQTAVYHILQAVGKHPALSHPDEDAFEAIDLWADGEAVQIKTGKGKPQILVAENIAFPGVQSMHSTGVDHYSSSDFLAQKAIIFLAKVKDYGRRLGKDLKGYTLVVPYDDIDHISGKPQQGLIEAFKQQLDEVAKLQQIPKI